MLEEKNVKCGDCGFEFVSKANVENIEAGKIVCKGENCESTNLTIVEAPVEKDTNDDISDLDREAKTLGVVGSKVDTIMYNPKKGGKSIEAENRKHGVMTNKRLENRIGKAKVAANLTPIEKRKAMITAKLRSAQNKKLKCQWGKGVLKALVAEYEIISANPKLWIKETQNGKKPYPVVEKKKKTVLDTINDMDMD